MATATKLPSAPAEHEVLVVAECVEMIEPTIGGSNIFLTSGKKVYVTLSPLEAAKALDIFITNLGRSG